MLFFEIKFHPLSIYNPICDVIHDGFWY
jgi:hypothetical protein